MKPVQIDSKEWWYRGCFIQEQNHPKLKRFNVFKDTENQENIDQCHTFSEAKLIARNNEIKNYKYGYKTFL